MRYEVSERFKSSRTADEVWRVLLDQVTKISDRVSHESDGVTVHGIVATFGSINRTTFAKVRVQPREAGFLLTADVTYTPSGFFWLFFIIGLVSPGWVWFLIPLGFYLYQKGMVRDALQQAFKRVRDEVES
jgi:hypothetical protein